MQDQGETTAPALNRSLAMSSYRIGTVNALRNEGLSMQMSPPMRQKVARKIELLEAGLKAMTEPEPKGSGGGCST